MLITEKIEKIKKNSVDFFQSLRQFSVKFNDKISKQFVSVNFQKIKKNIKI